VYAITSTFLGGLGHDVALASQLGMAQAEDADVLRAAREQSRILVTRDRDFGALVFLQGQGPGVIYLRILPSTFNAVHQELARLLMLHAEEELQNSFVVVAPGSHRMRHVRRQQ
jgi:predicted nuclease of predicted toxin-antitoxin system